MTQSYILFILLRLQLEKTLSIQIQSDTMDTTQHCKNSSLTLEASGRMCEEPTVISKYLYNNNERRVILPPTGSPTGDSFISGISIIMLLYFFLMLRSSASPFLNPRVSSW